MAVNLGRKALCQILTKIVCKTIGVVASKKVNGIMLQKGIGGVLISRTLIFEPVGGYTTESVTHGHALRRQTSQPQSITAAWPVPNYTAWWQKHMCILHVTTCPESLRTRQCYGWEHSSRIRYLRFFKSKNATFYVFWSGILKNVKNVIQNSKFQTLLTFHYMESPLGPYSSKTMHVYN